MGCLAEKSRGLLTFRAVRQASDHGRARDLIADALPPVVASVLEPAELETIRLRLLELPKPPERARLGWDDGRGALGVSNAIAVALLFVAGYAFGHLTGRRPVGMGSAMVVLGSILVGITIALGG